MKIVIIDDHSLFSHGIKSFLKYDNDTLDIHMFSSYSEFGNSGMDFNSVSILISDYEIPGEDTMEEIQKIKENIARLPILLVSMHNRPSIYSQCNEIGIDGYILKNNVDDLKIAINAITKGGKYFGSEVLSSFQNSALTINRITKQELKIIELVKKGYSNYDISDTLSVTVETIKSHKRNIRLKLGLETIKDISKVDI